jgi:4-amino-4-deoxy-L-arabinose transferase-like glycosyltransferase
MNSRSIYLTLTVYFVILLWIAPINILSFDTYYYWDWSRHLALSYYDGSPLIAYFIRLSTSLFGNSLFALSCVGIAASAITSGIIYKTARFFLSKTASCIAMLSWLFAPLVTMDILRQTTYDAPLTLFWALTLYYTAKFIKTKQIKELYFMGASAGLMMLSKYTGIVLILALFIFFIFSTYRSIFKTKHFYFALCLALFIFSPVIIWNYQNHWQSFIYQLSTHKVADSVNPLYNAFKTFFIIVLPALNIMLIPPFLVRFIKVDDRNAEFVRLCWIICITFLCFYLFASTKTGIRELWLAPYLISSALLFGYCVEITHYSKSALAFIVIYFLISLCILVDNTSNYNLIQVIPNYLMSFLPLAGSKLECCSFLKINPLFILWVVVTSKINTLFGGLISTNKLQIKH